jgi:hypothetical protein
MIVETVVTTLDEDGGVNFAAMGVVWGEDRLVIATQLELISQLDLLNQEKQNMLTRMSDLNDQNQEMQTELNSVYYALDLPKVLTEKGIIKGGFLRSTKLQKVDHTLFDKSLDLRGEPRITVNAAALQLARIRDISIYPAYFKAGVDFKVEIDETGQNATITFLEVKKFMSEKLAIAVD